MPEIKSAYRKQNFTESALLQVYSDIWEARDDSNVCLLGFLDLSAAFDMLTITFF